MEGKLLIIGAGSIGRRHAQNAHALDIRLVICDPDLERARKLAEEVSAEGYYADHQEACEKNKDIVGAVIASPSRFHIEQARMLADKEIHLFIEKPLAVEKKGIDELIELVERKNIVVMMGQSYRFHEGHLALKKMLEEETIGKVYHVNLFGGHYLPDWHPTMDYRTEYAAQKKLGGGALLTSMSHAFDSLGWLFGEIQETVGWKARLSDLEMDVDDSVFCLMRTEQNIIIECQTDFLQRISEYSIIVVGETGTIKVDFVRHAISVQRRGEQTPTLTSYTFEPNKRYVEELRHFMDLIKGRIVRHPLDLYAGRKVVELLLSDNIKEITVI